MSASKARQARRAVLQPTAQSTKLTAPAPLSLPPVGGVRPVPVMTGPDMAFGNIGHLPAYADIPEEYKRGHNDYCRFVSEWFFSGRTKEDLARLQPKPGVDANQALAAVRAILTSWEPKHEHKEAGCAYLLSEWFALSPKVPA